MSVRRYQYRSTPLVSKYIPAFWYTGWKRGKVTPAILREQLSAFFDRTGQRSNLNNARYLRAIEETKRRFAFRRIRPYHINDVLQQYQHLDRSPCLPWVKYGYRTKGQLPLFFIKKFVHAVKYWGWKMRAPCLALGRSHIHPEKHKTRLIWGYPAHHAFAEGVFAMPFIEFFKNTRTPYTIWAKLYKGDFKTIMGSRLAKNTWLGLDFSNFDAHVPAWLIRDAFKLLEEFIDFDSYEHWGKPTDPNALRKLWREIVNYFINTPIQIDKEVFQKNQGIPSGSYFTQIIGTLCNSIMCNYVLESRQQYFHGDDSLLEVPGVDLPSVATQFKDYFGAVVNPSKCEVSDHPMYLGFRDCDGKPGTEAIKLLNQAAFPASRDRCLEDAVSRVYGLQLACFGINQEFMEKSEEFLSRHPPPNALDRDMQRTLDALGIPTGVSPLQVAYLLS